MSTDVDVANLFKLYGLLQDLNSQHMVIDNTLNNLDGNIDFESLESTASAIINICEEIEKDLSPVKCCCVWNNYRKF